VTDQAEFWDKRYEGDDFAFGTEPNSFLVSQSHLFKAGQRALVPGDGEGRNGVWLAKQGLRVDTADVSSLGVAKARKLAQTAGAELSAEIADLLTWTWPRAQYDIVAAIYVHFFDEDRPRIHRAMLDALKPGGILILEAYRLEQAEFKKLHHSGGPPDANMLYSAGKLRDDFEGATILQLEELEAELSEGVRHRGRAAIVRAIVQKPA
jgi:SAM-dependent methyltransferase